MDVTEKFRKMLVDDHWIDLPDAIQEGNALQSMAKTEPLIVVCNPSEV
ncbi:hypothetical protein SAMN05421732_10785 [Acinetobacter kookii]|uniref:Uncharacterized protein n=1 Tax=Acinetobacter kookii TaxID=1226327 RepID=A0A1G6LZ62_9GAMM|nr:hypothetical protein SAMN05421732_10785 [Acinetobacter kookii]